MKALYLYTIYLLPATLFSQKVNSFMNWEKQRHEITMGLGASGFLGDLGGLNKVGADYSLVDLEFTQTKTALGLGYRYKTQNRINLSVGFNYLKVAGDDKLTQEPYRHNRNLNFKSSVFELSARAELILLTNSNGKKVYRIKTLKRKTRLHYELIAFGGVGCFYFNPKGKNQLTNEWISLYALHTEGQGLSGGPKQYSRLAACLPFGLYYRVIINRTWNIGLEYCFRKTFTDYIDDVSTTYYNSSVLSNSYGVLSAQMADPNLNQIPNATAPNADGTGAQRGDKQKDSYMSLQLKIGLPISVIKNKLKKNVKIRSKF